MPDQPRRPGTGNPGPGDPARDTHPTSGFGGTDAPAPGGFSGRDARYAAGGPSAAGDPKPGGVSSGAAASAAENRHGGSGPAGGPVQGESGTDPAAGAAASERPGSAAGSVAAGGKAASGAAGGRSASEQPANPAADGGKRDPYDYPRDWEADVVLSDGGTVHLRPVVPSDADGLVALHSRLSDRTRYFRYFGAYPRIPPRDLERFSTVDHHDRVAFVALLGDDVVAVGRYERLDQGPSAEVAFVVDDKHQGRGLGSILLEHLAAAASECGLRRFVAEVLSENAAMVRVFRDAGYQVSRAIEEGVLHLEFDIDPTEESLAVARSREQAAEARSVHNLLHPGTVAVIGASADPTKVGHVAFANLLAADFAGAVYPVNPEHRSVRGVRAYPSVLDIPDPVDLALVAVPAEAVESVLDACLAKGVKTLVIVSGGFAESGPLGLHAELRLVGEARAHGMRVVGPNALGVLNTAKDVRLNATLAPRLPKRGRTGFFCQSGALGTAILADAGSRGLGLSTFVSAGNRADVSGNDLLQYWETDPDTDLVLLYLESFGNPRKFARLARRLARSKPIVAVKSGRHAVRPQLAATSAEVDEASVQALFEQAGVVRVESLAQLFDTALVFAHQPLPHGAEDRDRRELQCDRVAGGGYRSGGGVAAGVRSGRHRAAGWAGRVRYGGSGGVGFAGYRRVDSGVCAAGGDSWGCVRASVARSGVGDEAVEADRLDVPRCGRRAGRVGGAFGRRGADAWVDSVVFEPRACSERVGESGAVRRVAATAAGDIGAA